MPRLTFIVITALAFLTGCATLTNKDQSVSEELKKYQLIPRETLFGNPERAAVRLSPDGQTMSWLAPRDGVMNIWVAPVTNPSDARPITNDRHRGIRSYFWAYTNQHVLYIQDRDGDENWNVYRVNVETAEATNLTDIEGVRAEIEAVSHREPGKILVGLNNRNEQFHDLYELDLMTGERRMIQQNDEWAGFVTDDDYRVRFATKYQPDGTILYSRKTPSGWEEFMVVPEEDTLNTGLGGFDKSGRVAYLYDSRGRNTTALKSVNLETGEETLIAHDPRADIGGLLSHPTENTIEAVSFEYDRTRWIFLDETVEADFAFLRNVADGDIIITARTLDDNLWMVAYLNDAGPVDYYLFDREERTADYLFSNRSDLKGLPLQPMQPVIIKSRDGLNLVSYLTLPPHAGANEDGIPAEPLPMVLDVHGGPWARDSWGYNATHQWLANRGYAVLSVNFRGSTGFGKDFINAGNKEWGAKMQDDLTDAVNWATERGIADPDRVAIMGGSYGGYATLAGLTFTPDLYAAGVSIVGPSNIITLLETIPPYWAPAIQLFKTRVGDHTTEQGREFLESRSPLNFADRIAAPLLIGQGANDPRVKQSESDQIVEAMEQKGLPVTYVLYPDEGHGFARPENRISFNAVTEAFLAENLGGRFEPIGGAFEGSSITVPHGENQVPGLAPALKPSE